MKDKYPIISVVMVCLNAEKHIKEAIESVLNQTYKNLELVIVDGGSTDRTLEIVKSYFEKDHRVFPLVQEGKGIYEAMNIAMFHTQANISEGYVLFLNSDDLIHRCNILEDVIEESNGEDIIYGHTMLINEEGEGLGLRANLTPHKFPDEGLTWKSLKHGMVVSHQSFLVKMKLLAYLPPPFNTKYKICADIDWMIECLKRADSVRNSRYVISDFRIGGISSKKRKLAWIERFRILSHHYGFLQNVIAHIYIVYRYLTFKRMIV